MKNQSEHIRINCAQAKTPSSYAALRHVTGVKHPRNFMRVRQFPNFKTLRQFPME
jgi:hypothetical protein